jgi:DNA-binding NarL/FixJ family response regulator
MRKALVCLLLSLPICGRAGVPFDFDSIDEASNALKDDKIDILMIDVDGTEDVLNVVSKVRSISPSTRVLLLARLFDEKFAIEAVRSGAWGLMRTQSDPVLLQQAIQKISSGEMWFSHGTMSIALQAFAGRDQSKESALDRLTAREAEVLRLLVRGYHNKEIASRLYVSESTVKTHMKGIYRKLGVNSRVEAVLLYTNTTGAPLHPLGPPEAAQFLAGEHPPAEHRSMAPSKQFQAV